MRRSVEGLSAGGHPYSNLFIENGPGLLQNNFSVSKHFTSGVIDLKVVNVNLRKGSTLLLSARLCRSAELWSKLISVDDLPLIAIFT